MEKEALEFVVVDRLGASSGCACGGATDPELPRFAGDLEWLRWQGVTVRRLDPRVHSAELSGLPAALWASDDEGLRALPMVLPNGQVVDSGSHLSRERLSAVLDMSAKSPAAVARHEAGRGSDDS